MDFLNKLADSANKQGQHPPQQQSSGGTNDLLGKLGNFAGGSSQQPQAQPQQSGAGGLFDKLHGLAGGGPESEKKEDALDKGIDWVQEKVLKQGGQANESAAEQAKDNLIADTIRDQYKKATGKDFPVKDKKEEKPASGGLGGFGKQFGF